MEDAIPACESCKISFIASDSVLATICGHLFHEICVNRIISGTTKKCPECQIPCLPSQLLRIFLPFQQDASTPESVVSNYKMVKHELREAQKEYAYEQQVQSELDGLVVRNTQALRSKGEKVAKLKALNKEKEKLQKKIKKLEKTHSVQKAMIGTQKDVEKVINEKLPADTLATMVAVLKRERKRTEAEKTEMRLKMREEQKDNKILTAKYRNTRDKLEIAIARSIKNKGGQN
ncbi:uncharacterized protein LOC119071085 [Bradysia coprophila]|uniref:uncharacterized protein LOC119071085 n=1 Tax=Bradysia coprophila TaxID=38358 RepID=UPI00187D96CE|nr:uncharacterized protein LOC119071085 [Bradysia coprophila]